MDVIDVFLHITLCGMSLFLQILCDLYFCDPRVSIQSSSNKQRLIPSKPLSLVMPLDTTGTLL